MNDTIIYINKDNTLNLRIKDAVQPTLSHPRADEWYLIYQLHKNLILFDSGLFTNNYLICEQQQILIIEEYAPSILNKSSIKERGDIEKNLRLFDFQNKKTGRFSNLSGGTLLPIKLIEHTFIFQKEYMHKTVEYEINITKIKLSDFERL